MPPPVRTLALAVALLALAPFSRAPARAQELVPECEYAPDGPSHLVVGSVECLRFDSAMMGGVIPLTYYIPPACDPALGRQCPVLYLLHGLTGGYQQMLGARGQADNSLVRALTSGPPVDPRTVAEPWTYESTSTWVAKPALDFILIAPHGVTLADGYNPTPGQAKDCGWQDWNPDYWEGGSHPFYDGPPPRCASMFLDEVIPYVERYFPAIAARSGRALSGISYGSIGTGHIGLRRPDLFSSLHQISGQGPPWPPACMVDPGGAEVAAPLEFPLVLGSPGVQPIIESLVDPPLIYISQNGDGLGTDYAYTRQHYPPDLMVKRARIPRRRAGDPLVVQRERHGSAPDRGAHRSVHAGRCRARVCARDEPVAARRPGGHRALGAPHLRVPPGHPLASVLGALLPRVDGGDVLGRPALGRQRPRLPGARRVRLPDDVQELRGLGLAVRDRPPDPGIHQPDERLVRFAHAARHRRRDRHGAEVVRHRRRGHERGHRRSRPFDARERAGRARSVRFVRQHETVALADLDGDGFAGEGDNCPQVANPDQLDRGGVATSTPDGIGDACRCGDVTGNGIVNGQDANAIKRHGLAQSEPTFRVPGNCDVSGNGLCNGQDAIAVKRAALGQPSPLFGQRCHNAQGLPVPPHL